MACKVCNGLGDYPIIDCRGAEWGMINCPACLGSGLSDEEADLASRQRHDQARYEATMHACRIKPKGVQA